MFSSLHLRFTSRLIGPAGLDGQHSSASSGAADVVRYDTSGNETRYWLKHKAEMKGTAQDAGKVVDASAKLK